MKKVMFLCTLLTSAEARWLKALQGNEVKVFLNHVCGCVSDRVETGVEL